MATHKEYTLTVKKTIFQSIGTTTATHRKKGEKVKFSEESFKKLQAGETLEYDVIAGHGEWAIISYDKYSFENEAEVLVIETTTTSARLGQRKTKTKA